MDVIHIEDTDSDAEYEKDVSCIHMLCGASCVLIGDDPEPIPEMDWYMLKDGHKATCPSCLCFLKLLRVDAQCVAVPT